MCTHPRAFGGSRLELPPLRVTKGALKLAKVAARRDQDAKLERDANAVERGRKLLTK
jgi:hypothetical protein